ncbi:putative disease resistance protein RGA1 [Phragmites australis]|uniref:putative disease resistance protein RGA1 n=1 Tax=Phragmites australis TaxID=29695 RepID=UPI002D779C5A|nr:putative disease resistance protein RGA1 [Phragmites australis]
MSALEVQSVLQKMAAMRDGGGGWPPGVQVEFQELYAVLDKVQRKVTHAEPLVDSRSSAAYSLFLADLRRVALTVDDALDGYSASARRSPYRHKLRGLLSVAASSVSTPLAVPTPLLAGQLARKLSRRPSAGHAEQPLPPALRPKIARQFEEAGKDLRMLLRLFTTYVADLLPPPEHPHRDAPGLGAAPKTKKAASSLSQEHGLIGRSQDQANVSRLLQDGGAGVVAIVGMAGVGKTALARAVYMAAKDDGFDFTLWVDVSQDFNPEGIFRLVMSELRKQLRPREDPESFWWSLNEGMINKRYLLVLDDVWNEDQGKWNQLMHLLYGNVVMNNSGKIIVTTRIPAAAMAIRSAETYHVRPLTVEDTLKLLKKSNKKQLKLLLKKNSKLRRGHRNAAMSAAAAERSNERQVSERCSGLPGIIDLMSSKLEALCDKKVADPLGQFNMICAGNEELLRVGEASYNHLPAHLQRCFLYCSLFPHDHIFDAEEMTGLLVAEGLTQISSREVAQGGGDFTRLLNECFDAVQKPGSKGEVGYKMHRVLHILARRKGKELYKAITGDHSAGLTEHSNIRYMSLMVDGRAKELPKLLNEQKDLRTLILLREQQMVLSCRKSEIREIPSDYCHYLTALRVLDLQATRIDKLPEPFRMLSNMRYLNLAQTDIAELPESLGRLEYLIYLNISQTSIAAVPESIGRIHSLRYLNLSRTVVGKLPDSVGTLRLLQTLQLSHCERLLKLPHTISSLTSLQKLDLQGCQYLSEMPQDISSMKNLKELNVLDCASLDKMPCGLSALTKIEALPRYIANSGDNNPILELQGLANLKRLGLENIEKISVEDAANIQLQEKHKLEHLTLHCNMDAESGNPRVVEELLDRLEPNRGLKTLEIISYAGERFPRWMANRDPQLKKLTHIRLINLKCTSLPALGHLPRLTTLEINGMNAIEQVSKELNGEPNGESATFRSLKSITFCQMVGLESWPKDNGATCPHLEELSFIQCPKFQELSMKLPIKKLTICMSPHELLGKEGLAGVASSLKSLSISLCEELSSSSNSEGLMALSSLEELEISGCDELDSLPPCVENLASLKSLSIIGCSKLHDLTDLLECTRRGRLRSLHISGCPRVPPVPEGLRGITTCE